MDEIIPGSDNMPAASQVGSVEYLDRLARQIPALKRELEEALGKLEEVSRQGFARSFPKLSHIERMQTLRALEAQAPPKSFSTLRNYVYEAYYTQPKVWRLIGYEFHATDQAGPQMKPFDEAMLVKARKKEKLYREAG